MHSVFPLKSAIALEIIINLITHYCTHVGETYLQLLSVVQLVSLKFCDSLFFIYISDHIMAGFVFYHIVAGPDVRFSLL